MHEPPEIAQHQDAQVEQETPPLRISARIRAQQHATKTTIERSYGVAEAAVVPRQDDLTGQAIVCFVTLEEGEQGDALQRELIAHVVKEIGSLARPAALYFTDALPKTRSGKIMRRLLADVAAGRPPGDTTTLEDAGVLEELRRIADETT